MATTYLHRTSPTAGNRTKGTMECCVVKRSK